MAADHHARGSGRRWGGCNGHDGYSITATPPAIARLPRYSAAIDTRRAFLCNGRRDDLPPQVGPQHEDNEYAGAAHRGLVDGVERDAAWLRERRLHEPHTEGRGDRR